MKFVTFIMLICIIVPAGFAQDGPRHKNPVIHKKMEELEKIKLIEVLEADEETLVRFFSRRKDFLDKTNSLEQSREQKVENLEKLLENSANDDELKKQISQIETIENALGQQRAKYIASLSEILNFQQVAKVLIFERNFRKELRAMILKERKRRN